MTRYVFVIYFVCFFINLESLFSAYTRTIQIKQGLVRGVRSLSGVDRYYGIPYATAERFQVPQSPKKWSGVFNAVVRFGTCPQIRQNTIKGSEDCLHLDVFTPENAQPGDNLPVLVFFHGGAYFIGAKTLYDSTFIAAKDVIVVTVNYRLGVLGFLCLNGVSNLGLRDQVAALKWVKTNIFQFGGDPDNVIIGGQSAGAITSGMHFLSSASTGLFHKAILFSGDPTTTWAFNLEHRRTAFEDASKLGYVYNEEDVYNLFLNASLNDILLSTPDKITNSQYFRYTPCVDSHYPDPFFTDAPYNILKSGNFNKVPVIIGNNNREGIFFLGWLTNKEVAEFGDNLLEKIPSVFSECSYEYKINAATHLYNYYFETNRKRNDEKGVIDFYGSWIATVGAFAKELAKFSNQPVYNYLFTYEGDRNFGKLLFGRGTRQGGVAHTDDLPYFFQPFGLPLPFSKRDRLFTDRQVTMMTNFMKFGDPTPAKTKLLPIRWPALTAHSSQRLIIDEKLSLGDALPSPKEQFFLDLLCRYGKSGFMPCEKIDTCGEFS